MVKWEAEIKERGRDGTSRHLTSFLIQRKRTMTGVSSSSSGGLKSLTLSGTS